MTTEKTIGEKSIVGSGPLVSVVMPVFNRAEYVVEAIESVLAQTYTHWELILVDDGSTDDSYTIEQGYAAKLPEGIRCITHEGRANRGISASRNLGSSAARGEYVACLDSDDLWVPDKLERQIAIVKAHPTVGMVVGSTKYWFPGESRLDRVLLAGGPRDSLIEPPQLFYDMYPMGEGVAPSMNTVLLRKDVVERIGGWEESFRTTYEDQAMLAKVYLSEQVYIASDVGDHYRQHPTSIMRTELVGVRYFRKRYLFLRWLESWMRTERPDRIPELKLVRNALSDRSLWAFRDPVRYNGWRVLIKVGKILSKVTRWSERN